MTPKGRSRSHIAIFEIRPLDGKCEYLQMPPTHFCASSYRFKDIKIVNIWLPNCRTRSRIVIFATTTFDGKFQNLKLSSTHFCASSYRFKDIKQLIFDHQKVGEGHRLQFSKLGHWMANVKIYKYLPNILR